MSHIRWYHLAIYPSVSTPGPSVPSTGPIPPRYLGHFTLPVRHHHLFRRLGLSDVVGHRIATSSGRSNPYREVETWYCYTEIPFIAPAESSWLTKNIDIGHCHTLGRPNVSRPLYRTYKPHRSSGGEYSPSRLTENRKYKHWVTSVHNPLFSSGALLSSSYLLVPRFTIISERLGLSFPIMGLY